MIPAATISTSINEFGHGHVTKRGDGLQALCGGPKCCMECALELAAVFEAARDAGQVPARYIVHEAGEIAADGSQACSRCGFVILDAAPENADRSLWGFGVGRRVIQGPTCTYLVTADRGLAPDEVPCQ